MSEYKISKRYASAFFQLGKEKNCLPEFEKNVKHIHSIVSGSAELKQLMANPILSQNQKISALTKIFTGINPLTSNFLGLIIQKKREVYLEDILKHFLQMVDEGNGVPRAHVRSTAVLDQAMLSKLESVLKTKTGKNVSIESAVDQSLKGGVIVKINDTVFDASVKHQIELLKNRFLSLN